MKFIFYFNKAVFYKFLLCFFIIIFGFVFFTSCSVSAFNYEEDPTIYHVSNKPDKTYDLSSLSNLYYIFTVCHRGSNIYSYFLVVSESPISCGDPTTANPTVFRSSTPIHYACGGATITSSSDPISNAISGCIIGLQNSTTTSISNYFKDYATGYDTITIDDVNVSCNHEITSINNSDIVVFQAPPQQVEGIQVLSPIVEGQEMKPLQEIIQILPVVILVVVGLIAIRKAIQWVMATMRRTIKIFLKVF